MFSGSEVSDAEETLESVDSFSFTILSSSRLCIPILGGNFKGLCVSPTAPDFVQNSGPEP